MAFGPPNSSSKALYYLSWANPPGLFRIRYTGSANRSPVAIAQASPTNGNLPLTTIFNGTQSSDPDNHPLSFDWDFGDGSNHSNAASPSHQYETAGTYTATLTVSDGQGGEDTAEIRIDAGTMPRSVDRLADCEPAVQGRRDGHVVRQRGQSRGPDRAELAVDVASREAPRHSYTPVPAAEPRYNTTITAPGPEDLGATANSYLEVRLTATDSQGLSSTVSRELRPRLVNLNFATNPAGLRIDLNGAVAPASITSWDGWTLQLGTPQTQFTSSGQGQNFVSWSDGAAPSHAITTPPTDSTYTATFTPNYVRPSGAQKTRVPLVPAHRRCTAPNRTHGAPLSYPSCTPAAPASATPPWALRMPTAHWRDRSGS